jgi:hypothetical protein
MEAFSSPFQLSGDLLIVQSHAMFFWESFCFVFDNLLVQSLTEKLRKNGTGISTRRNSCFAIISQTYPIFLQV